MTRPIRRLGLALAAALTATACQDQPLAVEPTASPTLAKTSSSARYQLQFVATDLATGGEIKSGPFPVDGVVLNVNDPWRQLTAAGAVVTLTGPTHGVRSRDFAGDPAAYTGRCRFDADVDVNWDIADASSGGYLSRSFAGQWLMTVGISRDRNGVNFYLAGPRQAWPNGEPGSGSIQNIASNGNRPTESRSNDGSEFTIEFTDARLGFGSPSSPDGAGTLADLPGYETACANFKLVATRIS